MFKSDFVHFFDGAHGGGDPSAAAAALLFIGDDRSTCRPAGRRLFGCLAVEDFVGFAVPGGDEQFVDVGNIKTFQDLGRLLLDEFPKGFFIGRRLAPMLADVLPVQNGQGFERGLFPLKAFPLSAAATSQSKPS